MSNVANKVKVHALEKQGQGPATFAFGSHSVYYYYYLRTCYFATLIIYQEQF
jgi:hypothetical protein